MGIPSYYRKLIRSCPHLVQDGADAADSRGSQDSQGSQGSRDIQWFFMDYNCLIYHCLYRPDAPVYPSEAETDSSIKTAWEAAFIKSVVEYTMYVIRQVNPAKGVYIAIDGVVPMAKMRQQRLRRFKSSWLSSRGYGRDGKKEESEESEEKEAVARWNTNAITPGTVFMDALYEALTRMIKAEGKTGVWRISSCLEWGEGEHKIMAEWRKGYGGKGSIAVYGLDADLIVLSLLGIEVCGLKEGVWLFREIVERGATQYDMFGRERYEWFSVDELRRWLVAPYLGSPLMEQSFIIQYTFMMSFLGNDFLPSSLSYKMRDDGHGILLDLLRWFFAGNVLLVGGADEGYPIRQEGLTAFFQALALNESERITATIWKKKRMAQGRQDVQVGHEDWPLAIMEEEVLLDSRGQLSEDWQHQYIAHFFHGFPWHPSSVKTLCRQYLYGVQWVWAYYLGRTEDVCFEWWYPFSLPPLWSWLSESELPAFLGTVQVKGSDIAPTEQLALVLPLESWSLLPPCPQRVLPYRAPHLFPTEFSFDSAGKRFFWECESMIPVPTIREVKAWCS